MNGFEYDCERAVIRQDPPEPFNQVLHDFLISKGYRRYHEPAVVYVEREDFDPAYDEYINEDIRVVVTRWINR